ncbi:MAG: hypothetical protein FD126_1531, partial [Elusimicrobia bacterium]
RPNPAAGLSLFEFWLISWLGFGAFVFGKYFFFSDRTVLWATNMSLFNFAPWYFGLLGALVAGRDCLPNPGLFGLAKGAIAGFGGGVLIGFALVSAFFFVAVIGESLAKRLALPERFGKYRTVTGPKKGGPLVGKRKLVLPAWVQGASIFLGGVGGLAALGLTPPDLDLSWKGFAAMAAVAGGACAAVILLTKAEELDRLYFINDRTQYFHLSAGILSLPTPDSPAEAMHSPTPPRTLGENGRIVFLIVFSLVSFCAARHFGFSEGFKRTFWWAGLFLGWVLLWAFPDGGAKRSVSLLARGLAGTIPDRSRRNHEGWVIDSWGFLTPP